MLFYMVFGLTFLSICFILIIALKKGKKYFARVSYKQSDIHQIVKNFIPKDLFEMPKMLSQSRKHLNKSSVKVLMMGDQAYWVHNNMFYVANTVEGLVDPETVRPVDTNNMSNRDIDKMLFILDSLRNGNFDDSSGTGNNRF